MKSTLTVNHHDYIAHGSFDLDTGDGDFTEITYYFSTQGNISKITAGTDGEAEFYHEYQKIMDGFETATELRIRSFQILENPDERWRIFVVHEPKSQNTVLAEAVWWKTHSR